MLPFTRDANLAAGSQLPSALINELQDVDIANIGDLILTLGGTTSNDLNDMFAQGTFTPILDATQSGITYSKQNGNYVRVGRYVLAMIELEWTNNDDLQNTDDVEIVPPFEVYNDGAGSFYAGFVNTFRCAFGTDASSFTSAALGLEQVSGARIRVEGRATTLGSAAVSLDLGNSESRRVVGAIWYRTDGTFNY